MTGRFGKADSFRKVATRLMPVFGVAFAAAFVLCSVFAASTITSAIGEEPSNDGYYVLIKSSDVTLDVLSVPTGAMTVVSSTVKTTTNNPYGYTLYLGMSPEDSEGNEKSAADKLKNGLYEDEDLTSTNLVSAVNATGSDPKPLDINNWGYAVDSATTGAPESWAGLTHTAMLNSAPTDDKFAAVPAVGSEEKLQSTSTPNTNIAEEDWQEYYWDDSTKYTAANVWYGINANTNLPDGAYSNTIAYTAVANPQPTVYTLNYAPGTPDTVTGLPTTQTVTEASASHTFTISANIPERDGYAFTGYSDGTTTYQPRDTITVASTSQFVGTVTLTAQWEVGCAEGANRICYVSNEPSGAGTVSGTSPDQTIVYMTSNTASGTIDQAALSSSTTELTLTSPNMTLTDYGFAGWNTAADGSGTPYGPNETIKLTAAQQTQLGTGGIMLYAQWIHQTGTMDAFSCSSLTNIGDITARTYNGDTYAIAKLADGKCWMIENLRYDVNSPDGAGTKTTTFSTSEYNLRQYNVTNIDGEDGAYPINLTSPAGASSTTNQYQWKFYGGYYSWASAIKTTSTSSSQYYNWNGTSFSDSTSAIAQGICPSGWRLPRSYAGSATNNPESDFRNLNNELNGSWTSVSTAAASNEWRKYPNNFVFAGYWSSSSSGSRGTGGYYWSSTVIDGGGANSLRFDSTSVYPDRYGNKYAGRSVRCVASS